MDTTPRAKPLSPMRAFDPDKVAYAETYAWVAYYQRKWFTLLRLLLSLSQHAFGLTLPQAIAASYLGTRAQVAFAPSPNNDVPKAVAYQKKFYRYIKRVHPSEPFDPDKAGDLDVNWWVVHRRLFAQRENQPLIEAVADLYAETYRVPRERVMTAAVLRAEAMQYSDRWVREGHVSGSPLIAQEEIELRKSYAALREAVAA